MSPVTLGTLATENCFGDFDGVIGKRDLRACQTEVLSSIPATFSQLSRVRHEDSLH